MPEFKPSPVEKGTPLSRPAHLLHDVPLPAAVVFEAPLTHNLAWMQRFADEHGAKLAPHGKTTMAPALFKRQIASGAWGITLATAVQTVAAHAHGIDRVLMVNQLVGRPNMALVADAIEAGLAYCCVVDGADNVRDLGAFFAERGLILNVLIELGVDGGRCGCRTAEQVETLVAAIAEQPALALVGIEGYEGMIAGGDEAASVCAYGKRLVDTVRTLQASGVLQCEAPIVTASGSKWFDLIAEAFDQAALREHYTPVLRPGCYVVHDHKLYAGAMANVKARHPGLEGELQPALEVFAHVQSLPEPGLAIIALGKRDIGHEPDLPLPLRRYPWGTEGEPWFDVSGWRTTHIMDQHVFLALPEDADIAVGDVIAFGTSHPCLTFDKWRRVLCVDASLEVTEVMATHF
ncbi:D-serine deaminase-like pyridoxal phosphate-dependent protein [Chromohalobacter marismortui]|uniref:D-serine deaminase-like pyridoxal phosphate-dependent protein n=1 Tax=Chromohalobacter marismortui TaxID=42055 RepID=A0A4V6Q438_9GAMM|nr:MULTISPECIES: amino acid deaminase [Chromohalobacter]MCI0509874.1 amino acid deaminase [Chromohalobacter sp.]MCI0591880.1 amino acid deaminase [Chromohalobacter sp.]TDU22096.1 D-serine deaminase-like pyridoxal phosphate-dependent protein [Chromohalobacter marismortui]